MKTTLNLDDELISEAMKLYDVRTKTRIIEMALEELINSAKRKKLAALYGNAKNIKPVPRRKM